MPRVAAVSTTSMGNAVAINLTGGGRNSLEDREMAMRIWYAFWGVCVPVVAARSPALLTATCETELVKCLGETRIAPGSLPIIANNPDEQKTAEDQWKG